MKKFLIITGPTGIGKSEIALKCAKHFQAPLFSIDSMLVYKGLNIGTAKPSAAEMSEVKHYCIDTVPVNESYDVSQYLDDVNECYEKEKGRIIGVGGTPFYIHALQKGLTNIDTNPKYDGFFEKFETSELKRWLNRLDPKRSEQLHDNDRFRLTRALQIILSLGQKASEFGIGKENINNVTIIGLNAPREIMHKRIEERVDKMFDAGLLEEAKELFIQEDLSRSALSAVGYKELFSHFRGEMSLEMAREKIIVATRRLLKHQMTWFRKMNIEWVDVDFENPNSAFDSLIPLIQSHFEDMDKREYN